MLGRVQLTMTVTNVLVVAVVIVALLLAAFLVAQRVINQNADRELISIAESVQRGAGRTGFGAIGGRPSPFRQFRPDGSVPIDLREFARRDPPLEFAIFNTSGEYALPFEAPPDPLPITQDVQRALEGNRQVSTVKSDGGSLRVVTQPILDSEGAVIAVVQVAESRQAQDQIVDTLRNVLLAVGGAGLLFAAGAGYLLTGRTMRPVNVAMERQKAFVADAAHELRTPLAIISANAEALDMHGPVLPEADSELLAGIRTESTYLAALISKLLEMARLDFEEGDFGDEPVDLAQVVRDSCEAVSVLATARGISLEPPVTGDPVVIRGDQVLARLIVLSLLDNAIKYNRENGKVSVAIESTETMAAVRIGDEGPGIPPEHLERVFDRFYRVDKARSRKTGGAGLGLAIASRAAGLINGQLDLTGDADTGTVATVKFQRD